jgi:hypothetical protein
MKHTVVRSEDIWFVPGNVELFYTNVETEDTCDRLGLALSAEYGTHAVDHTKFPDLLEVVMFAN